MDAPPADLFQGGATHPPDGTRPPRRQSDRAQRRTHERGRLAGRRYRGSRGRRGQGRRSNGDQPAGRRPVGAEWRRVDLAELREWVHRHVGVAQARASSSADLRRKGSNMKKVWFITGTSRGFGREWTAASIGARRQGSRDGARHQDARRPSRQVRRRASADRARRHRPAADFAAVKQAHDQFGRLDIVVNNAGYGQFGFIEELSEKDVPTSSRRTSSARCGSLRRRCRICASSAGPHHSGVVDRRDQRVRECRHYHASKWALEGFSPGAVDEVEPFGIHVTLIEPGGFDTDWGGPRPSAPSRAPRTPRRRRSRRRFAGPRMSKPGDPKASAAAILKVVDAEKPPLRVFFGEAPSRSPRPTTRTGSRRGRNGSPSPSWPRASTCALGAFRR